MEQTTPQQEPQPQYQAPISEESQYPNPMDSTGSPKAPEPKHFLNKKFIVTFVVLVLIGVGAYAGIWWWQNQQYTFEDMNPVFTFTPRPSVSVTPDPITANWPIFNSKLLNFSFKYPLVANYQERDVFEDSAITHTGKDVYFTDKNSQSSAFSVITNDFSVNDSIPHDLMQGTLSTGNFILNIFDEKYQKKREVAPGMYEVIGYGNMECSPFIGAFLIVSPPAGSNFKYESFNLYSTPGVSEFIPSDMDSSSSDAQCTPKESVINSKIDYLFNQKDSVLERSLNTAIEIASTFQVSNQAADTSTWKTFSSKYFTLSFKVPLGFEVSESENTILIAKGQVIQGLAQDNVFFSVTRYIGTTTQASSMENFRKNHSNIKTSVIVVDGTSFTRLDGTYLGDDVTIESAIFLEKSGVNITPLYMGVPKPDFDRMAIGNQILSTFKFTK